MRIITDRLSIGHGDADARHLLTAVAISLYVGGTSSYSIPLSMNIITDVFLNKLKTNENSVVATWYYVSGFNEFKVICDRFVVPIDRPWGMRKHIWNNFVSNISVN